MKFEIQAGAHFETATPQEIKGILEGWRAELARGVKFRRFAGTDIVADDVWAIGPSVELGPEPGMIWAVTRMTVSGAGFDPTADTYAVNINEVSGMTQVTSGRTRSTEWDVGVLVLIGGEQLIVSGDGTNGSAVYLSGQAVELPVQFGHLLI